LKKKLRLKLEQLSAAILFCGSILYICGQCGNADLDVITLRQFVYRSGAAIIVLGLTAVFVKRHFVDGEWV